MKKKFFSIAILAMIAVFAFANAASMDVQTSLTQEDGYKVVKIEDLSEKIQTVIKDYEELFSVKELFFNEKEDLTKLSLVSKLDQSEKIVILDKDGKEVAAPAVPESEQKEE